MKFLNWIGGFFSSEKNTSSKRLVGIVGAFTLYFTLFHNSQNEFEPADSLVWATFSLSAVALGLTTIEAVTGLIKGKRNEN